MDFPVTDACNRNDGHIKGIDAIPPFYDHIAGRTYGNNKD